MNFFSEWHLVYATLGQTIAMGRRKRAAPFGFLGSSDLKGQQPGLRCQFQNPWILKPSIRFYFLRSSKAVSDACRSLLEKLECPFLKIIGFGILNLAIVIYLSFGFCNFFQYLFSDIKNKFQDSDTKDRELYKVN